MRDELKEESFFPCNKCGKPCGFFIQTLSGFFGYCDEHNPTVGWKQAGKIISANVNDRPKKDLTDFFNDID
jgi:hypothetical protein